MNVHTNTVEGYFSLFKRGMKGACQHCSEKHLHRYLAPIAESVGLFDSATPKQIAMSSNFC
ncbi:MAG: transposase [Alphaproteobacteria bacterium]|nr:transposase [Alphaproteobacteria bacterium]